MAPTALLITESRKLTESSRMFFVIAKMVPHFSFFFLLPFCRYVPTPPFAHCSRIQIFFSSELVCLDKVNILWEGIKVWKNFLLCFDITKKISKPFFSKKKNLLRKPQLYLPLSLWLFKNIGYLWRSNQLAPVQIIVDCSLNIWTILILDHSAQSPALQKRMASTWLPGGEHKL